MLLILLLVAQPVFSQDFGIFGLTVGEIQRVYEKEDDKETAQSTFQSFFNGILFGFVMGVDVTMIVSAGVDPDETTFGYCMPESRQIFHKMLGASGEQSELILPKFVVAVILEDCEAALRKIAVNPE